MFSLISVSLTRKKLANAISQQDYEIVLAEDPSELEYYNGNGHAQIHQKPISSISSIWNNKQSSSSSSSSSSSAHVAAQGQHEDKSLVVPAAESNPSSLDLSQLLATPSPSLSQVSQASQISIELDMAPGDDENHKKSEDASKPIFLTKLKFKQKLQK